MHLTRVLRPREKQGVCSVRLIQESGLTFEVDSGSSIVCSRYIGALSNKLLALAGNLGITGG